MHGSSKAFIAPLVNILPKGPQPFESRLVEHQEADTPEAETLNTGAISNTRRLRLIAWHPTAPNRFGIFCAYKFKDDTLPTIPDLEVTVKNLVSSVTKDEIIENVILPFPNLSTFLLAHWFFTGQPQKSVAERQRLVSKVILDPGLSVDYFRNQDLQALDRALDRLGEESSQSLFDLGGNWIGTNITISVPLMVRAGRMLRTSDKVQSDTALNEYGLPINVPGFRYRKLVDVIQSHFSVSTAKPDPFHFVPYGLMRRLSNGQEERVYDELFTGDAWLREHEAVQQLPPIEECSRPRVIAAIMLWSDATHLAQFGQSSMWPIYLQFGNRLKGDRARPSKKLTEYIGYLPSVQGDIETALKKPMADTLSAHIKREITHECWRKLLDDDFITAYRDGIVVECQDHVEGRLFPRIMTYSADYPEK
ncbi:hypothetical protein FRC12_000655 [Ceratobasidium sp. 428]|nr:hypothetical protein FRC12_000655 [Ceratobasidium sp. 428]